MPVTHEPTDLSVLGTVATTGAHFRCDSRSWTSPTGDIVVLSPVGDIDLSTVPVLHRALDEVLRGNPAHLVVDLVAAHFCDAYGFVLLADNARAATRIGSSYAVVGLDQHQGGLAVALWGACGPRRYPTTAAAVIDIQDRTPA